MKIHAHHAVRPAPPQPGFTLTEMMMAVAVSSLLIAGVVHLGMSTAKSFTLMGNYAALDAQSRHAADVLSREIRNASALVSFTTSGNPSLTLTNATAGTTVTITYHTNNTTLVFTKTGQPSQTLLTDCSSWSFQLFDRVPLITSTNITFYGSTNGSGQVTASFCKVIDMSWKCYRTIFGTKYGTENVQTAEIVLRNQINN